MENIFITKEISKDLNFLVKKTIKEYLNIETSGNSRDAYYIQCEMIKEATKKFTKEILNLLKFDNSEYNYHNEWDGLSINDMNINFVNNYILKITLFKKSQEFIFGCKDDDFGCMSCHSGHNDICYYIIDILLNEKMKKEIKENNKSYLYKF